MAKILLTGASGRLGSVVASLLLSSGHSVRAIVRPKSARQPPGGCECFEHDLAGGKLPPDAFSGVERVAHMAGLVGEHSLDVLMAQNAFATQSVASSCPPSIKRLVIASSISVYGEHKGKLVDEEFPPEPQGAYGASKKAAEESALKYAGSVSLALLRFGMIYGPGFEEGYFDALRLLSKGKLKLIGNGANRVPLIHVRDAAEAVEAALFAPALAHNKFNIVGSERLTQKELFSIAASELGAPMPSSSMPFPIALRLSKLAHGAFRWGVGKKPAFDPENIRQLGYDRAYSAERAKEELGFVAKIKLREGIKEMVSIYRSKNAY
jgi:nucleoside-diphosphate-sugar epimerase